MCTAQVCSSELIIVFAVLPDNHAECEGVGTVYLIGADIYRHLNATGRTGPPGCGAYHFPTAFTEHFPVVHAAKYELGWAVTLTLAATVYHANLPKYGLTWHKEPMEGIWDRWLQPYLGKSLADPELRNTVPPDWWEPPQLSAHVVDSQV